MRERGPVRAGAARRDGVIGVVVGVAGLWVLGVILGIVALVFGLKARRAGGGLTATAAVALGIIDIVVWVLAGGGWDSSPGYATLQPAPW